MKKSVKYFLTFILATSVLSGCSYEEDNFLGITSSEKEVDVSSEDTSKEVSSSKTKLQETSTPKPTKTPAKKIDKILNEYRKTWEVDDAEELASYDDKAVYAGICRAIKKEYKRNEKEIRKINYGKLITGDLLNSGSIYSVHDAYSDLEKLVKLYLDSFSKKYKKDSLVKVKKLVGDYEKEYDKFTNIQAKYESMQKFNSLLKAFNSAKEYDIYVVDLIKSTLGRKIEKFLTSDKGYYYYVNDAVYDSIFDEYGPGEEEFVLRTDAKLSQGGYQSLKLWNTGNDTTIEFDKSYERDLDVYEIYNEEEHKKLLKDKKSLNKIRTRAKQLDSEIKKRVLAL